MHKTINRVFTNRALIITCWVILLETICKGKFMHKRYFVLLFFMIFFSAMAIAQQDAETTEVIENNNFTEDIDESNDIDNGKLLFGPILSFSGFNQFRMGIGFFLGKLGSDGHHPLGYDYGLLFEYNFKQNLMYTRIYGHFTGGVSAILLGASIVSVFDSENISVGLAPEVGIGLSTVFKIFYRYNFYMNKDYNSYEIVFHLCIPLNKRS